MDEPRWIISTMAEAEAAINVLHRRSMRDKTEIDLLTAQMDLLRTPWWNQKARRRTKKWIASLSTERE